MFCLTADKVCLSVEQRETVTSGSVNVYEVQFKFSADWEGLDRTAVFAAGEEQVSVVLGSSNTCTIPWEALQSPRRELRAGVCGTRGGEVVLPTVWASLGTIREGCSPGDSAQPPTPDVYGQILAAANRAEQTAQSVRDDADAGVFDGETPYIGENGNWWIGGRDTEVYAGGDVPYIGENKNWYIGDEDTGVRAEGSPGPQGPAGAGVPEGGTAGQLLGKTKSGTAWVDPPQSGVQPDWNQNDPQAPDYVKNRPFYTGDPEEVELLDGTFAFEESNGLYLADVNPSSPLEVGKTCRTVWDGVAYSGAIQEVDGVVVAGNLSIFSSDFPDTGEPFCIIASGNVNSTSAASRAVITKIATPETGASHNIQMYSVSTEIVKIPEEYLPSISKPDFVTKAKLGGNRFAQIPEDVMNGSGIFSYYVPAIYQISNDGRNQWLEVPSFNPFYGIQYPVSEDGTIDMDNPEQYRKTVLVDYPEFKSVTFRITNRDRFSGSTGAISGNGFEVRGRGNIHDSIKQLFRVAWDGTIYFGEMPVAAVPVPAQNDIGKFLVVGSDGTPQWSSSLILPSSTPGSSKRFRITVDDSGVLSAEELVE